MKERLLKYFKSDRHYWWTVSLIPGLYLIAYLYRKNYFQVNSPEQLLGLSFWFLMLPSIITIILDLIIKKFQPGRRAQLYHLILALFCSLSISFIRYQGFHFKAMLVLGAVAIISSFFMAKHYKKFVLLTFLMLMIGLINWSSIYVDYLNASASWVDHDKFNGIEFQKKPNIYLIQPDGYASESALNKPYYSYDNKLFYNDLAQREFTFNDGYRSNYSSTLTSNSALFTATHHYLNYDKRSAELPLARSIILGSNPVLKTFRQNGYQTEFLSSSNYLRMNYTDVFYDHQNITTDYLSHFPRFRNDLDVFEDFKKRLEVNQKPTFYFFQVLEPGHISPGKNGSVGAVEERKMYLQKLKDVNPKLIELIDLITTTDNTGIIILLADHGGFIGLDYTGEIKERVIEDPLLKASMFSAMLAIKAPADFEPYQRNIKSSVSVFPNLFNYLGNKNPVDARDDSSYLFVTENDASTVYRYFDSDGNPVTEKLDP